MNLWVDRETAKKSIPPSPVFSLQNIGFVLGSRLDQYFYTASNTFSDAGCHMNRSDHLNSRDRPRENTKTRQSPAFGIFTPHPCMPTDKLVRVVRLPVTYVDRRGHSTVYCRAHRLAPGHFGCYDSVCIWLPALGISAYAGHRFGTQ